MRRRIVRVRRKDLDNRCIDDERHAQDQASIDLKRSSSDGIDGQDADRRTHERNDCVDGLD